MKSFSLNVPDEKALAFAINLFSLLQNHGVEKENKEVIDSLIPITERVKSFEDACRELGSTHPFVRFYRLYKSCFEFSNVEDTEFRKSSKTVMAYLKLRIVCAALNEGWSFLHSPGETRYDPFYVLVTEDELSEMNEERRKKVFLFDQPFVDGDAFCGMEYMYSRSLSTGKYTGSMSSLCFKDVGLSDYAGSQFIDLWANFLF